MSDPQSAEDRLIARFFRPLAKHPGAFRLTDDAAALAVPAGTDLVLTTDMIVSGIHFLPEDAADMVAKKALRVNVSDLAAKGAQPLGFLLSLALPGSIGEDWLDLFARGLGNDADAYSCPLFGGDTTRTTGPVTVSITALGTVPRDTMVRRSGAKPGDHILVTGTIGDAALGLRLRDVVTAVKHWKLDHHHQYHLIRRYLLPQPRCGLAEALRLHASAAMDVSDGLAGDLFKLCAASGVTAEIDVARVPLSAAAQSVVASDAASLETVLTGGDDYEIVCTVAPEKLESLNTAAVAAKVPVAEIGRVAAGAMIPRFVGGDGKPIRFKKASFSHF
ncbi:MAG: thiamine-phosphate kinase [Xanthobacteraceae bacterium]